ncbi:MAG: RNA polymerase sigma factor [Oscillospiraceae bacterium]|nr:RNA polymerase sigma factor [Oscillospiraceae bacterium]
MNNEQITPVLTNVNAERRRAEFERVVRGNAQKLYKTALAVTGNAGDAEEVVQDCCLRLWEKKPVFESESHETAWLIRVTVNLAKNRLSSAWRQRTVPLTESVPARGREERELLDVISKLPGPDRAVIHLFYYEGYSTAEIAQIVRRRESTVRSRLTRAREKLKGLLKEDEHESL